MSETLVKSIRDVMAEMATGKAAPQLVRDWKSMIPEGSKWRPNDPGDPFCQKCDGSGYIRLDGLPGGHPYFGKILFCECAEPKVRAWEARKMADSEADELRSMPTRYR